MTRAERRFTDPTRPKMEQKHWKTWQHYKGEFKNKIYFAFTPFRAQVTFPIRLMLSVVHQGKID